MRWRCHISSISTSLSYQESRAARRAPKPPGPKINLVRGGTPSYHPPQSTSSQSGRSRRGWAAEGAARPPDGDLLWPDANGGKGGRGGSHGPPKTPPEHHENRRRAEGEERKSKILGRRWPGSSCTCGPASTPTTKDPLVTGCQFAVVSVSLLKSVFFACSLL